MLTLCEGDCTAPPPPIPWYQAIASFVTTPTGFALTILAVGILAALWWAASNFYDTHALEIDAAETGGPVAVNAYKRRKRKR